MSISQEYIYTMSCDHNRATFVAQVAASLSIATALGNGDPEQAGRVLEALYQAAKNNAARTYERQWKSGDMSVQARAALLAAHVGCTALFARMIAAKLQLPVHGRPQPGHSFALPRSRVAQAGYAALEHTLRAIEQGHNLPSLTQEMLAARGIQEPTRRTQSTIQSHIDMMFGQRGSLSVDPARPPLAGFLRAIQDGSLNAETMDEQAFFQTMSNMIVRERIQQAIMRAPQLLDLANRGMTDRDPVLRHELDCVAEAISIEASDVSSQNIPSTLLAAVTAYQADPSSAPTFAGILAGASGHPRCCRCGQFQAASGLHSCSISSVFDTLPALRFQTEPLYRSQDGLDQLTAPDVHGALTATAQLLRGPAVPIRLRAAAETYLHDTVAGPSTAATRAFVQILGAAGDTTPETEHSRMLLHQVIADQVGEPACLDLANGIHADNARPAISGLRGVANGLLSTPDAPLDWRLTAAQWQYHRPFYDWSPTGDHDVAFACYLAEISDIGQCPQCQQFMSATRSHRCTAVPSAASPRSG